MLLHMTYHIKCHTKYLIITSSVKSQSFKAIDLIINFLMTKNLARKHFEKNNKCFVVHAFLNRSKCASPSMFEYRCMCHKMSIKLKTK